MVRVAVDCICDSTLKVLKIIASNRPHDAYSIVIKVPYVMRFY